MINTLRYQDVKKIFEKNKVALAEADIRLYADMFEIIAQLTNGKLTNEEMFSSFDFLSNLILGKEVRYAPVVRKEDRIRIQLRMMEELPELSGKLTEDEKRAFAFCVYQATCIQVYNEESGELQSGLTTFTSKDRIIGELNHEMSTCPEFFAVEAKSVLAHKLGKFAYSKDNPIQTTSIPMSYQYLNSLKYKGKPVKYERIGSFTGANGHLVDGYRINTKSGLFAKATEHIIYIDAYADTISQKAPEGFTLV